MSVQFPLYLMALSTTSSQNSQWSKGQAQVPAQVTVHPDSAGGLPDRGFGWLESAIASMPVQVLHDLRPRRDVALMAKGGHMRAKRNANVLARARATDIGGGGALYDEPVRHPMKLSERAPWPCARPLTKTGRRSSLDRNDQLAHDWMPRALMPRPTDGSLEET